jgi:hypothetical protein
VILGFSSIVFILGKQAIRPRQHAQILVTMAIVVNIERAAGLRSADFMGKSDPYVRLSWKGMVGRKPFMTSVIDNDNSPAWDECFLITEPADGNLHLQVYDSDAGAIVSGTDDFLGECTISTFVSLAELGGGWVSVRPVLTGPKAKGRLEVSLRRLPPGAALTLRVCRALNLKNTDGGLFSSNKSDPYAVVRGLLAEVGTISSNGLETLDRTLRGDAAAWCSPLTLR